MFLIELPVFDFLEPIGKALVNFLKVEYNWLAFFVINYSGVLVPLLIKIREISLNN